MPGKNYLNIKSAQFLKHRCIHDAFFNSFWFQIKAKTKYRVLEVHLWLTLLQIFINSIE